LGLAVAAVVLQQASDQRVVVVPVVIVLDLIKQLMLDKNLQL
jgi:hypothetical protein